MMEFISLVPLWWLLPLLALVGYAYRRTLSDRPKRWRRLSFAFRCLALICVILALCGPYLNKPSKAIHVVHLVDVSESVDLGECVAAMEQVIEFNAGLSVGDSSDVFVFADGVREVDPADALKMLEEWRDVLPDDRFRRETRLAEALRSSRLSFPAGKARRVVLYSDGVPTTGPVANELNRLEREGAVIQFNRLRRESRPEAAVVEVVPSASAVYAGERLRLKTRLTANTPMKARLRLLNRGVARASREIELTPDGENRFAFDVVVGMDDAPVWNVELVPEQDHFPANNQAGCEVSIVGRARVLALHREPRAMRHFRSALEKQDFGVEVRAPIGLPATLDEMLKFDAIVLADIPATDIPERAMRALKRYVIDFGGGLMMLGSENSFGLGGYYETPVEDVLPITSRFEKEKETPSMAMALVIDKSGSMGGAPIELARQAAKATVELLGPRDKIGVIGFDSQPFIVCEMTPAADIGRVQDSIDSLQAGGGTSMYPGMFEGERMLRSAGTRVRHMILLTDGQSSPGDFEGLAENMALSGITVSSVALGGGAAQDLLKRIAQIGRGRYYETMDPNSVPQIFTKETMAVSRSAIKEEPFLPVPVNTLGFLEGVDFDAVPYLLGYVMTRLKPTALSHLVTDGGDPLLASGQYGLGVGMAFTSDATDMWAGEWVEWKGYGPLWAQIMRRCLRKDRGAGIVARATEESSGIHLWIERRDAGLRPVNKVGWNGVALLEHGGERVIEPRQVGLGRYEAFLPMKEKQNTSIRLLDQDTGAARVISWRRDYPAEYRLSLVAAEGIAALPELDPDALIRRDDAIWRYVSARHYFVFAAMLFSILGVLFRRLG
jgi:uncharacterized membrane protein/uncharacterized protein YegL